MSTSSTLQTVAAFSLGKGEVSLKIAKGSVLDFRSPLKGAIVNAANEGCLGGGGVDGAITTAGGPNLAADRLKLPLLSKTKPIRCFTGSAVRTGPGKYGDLQVPHVIHAVGPNYHLFDAKEFREADFLLYQTYQSTLDQCLDADVSEVAFSLLSSGVFRGKRKRGRVLQIGICGIRDWVDNTEDHGSLKSITVCGYTALEVKTLLEACQIELK